MQKLLRRTAPLKRYAEKQIAKYRAAGKTDDWIASWKRSFWKGYRPEDKK